jgi:hypothetical protein
MTGITERVSVAADGSQANHMSIEPSISADGRYVAFQSAASSLVPGDTNKAWDVGPGADDLGSFALLVHEVGGRIKSVHLKKDIDDLYKTT